jgi:beta-lactamase regulating signal transducer with metallopeptidase domain
MFLSFPIERIGWVLLHFLWQAAALALVLAIALWAMKRSSSLMRYITACTILVLMAIAPIVTFALVPPPDPFTNVPIAVPEAVLTSVPPVLAPDRSTSIVPQSEDQAELLSRFQIWLAPKMRWLVALWCVGAALMLTRHLGAWLYLQKLLRRSSVPLRDSWARLAQLPERVGLKRHVLLLESTLLHVPATVGWVKPVVLLPASVLTGLSKEELEALVLHELAHIRRHDYLINVLQTIVETLLFYHPAVWCVSRQIRHERENCCDDIAADASGDAATYATALATIETLRPESPRFAMGAAGGSLLDRIKRLTLPRELAVRRRHGAAVVSSLLAALLLLLVQTQALSSIILQHRVRTLNEMPTFGEAVYSIMEMPEKNDELLPALQAVFAQTGKARTPDLHAPAVERLVTVLNRGGDPDALLKQAESAMSVSDKLAYQNRPDWKYGSVSQRVRLTDGWWTEAQTAASSDPTRAEQLARAAILLKGQEILDFGSPSLTKLFREDNGRNVPRLSSRQLAEFRQFLRDNQALQLLANAQVIQFSKDAKSLQDDSPQSRGALVASMIDSIDRLRQLAPHRLRVQWQVANLTQRLVHAPGFEACGVDLRPVAQRWAAELSQPQFNEWMRQAFDQAPSPGSTGAVVKTMSTEEFRRQMSRRKTSAIKKSRVEEGGGEPSSGSTLDRP